MDILKAERETWLWTQMSDYSVFQKAYKKN